MHRSALKSVGFGSCPERKAAHGLIPGQAQAVAFKVFFSGDGAAFGLDSSCSTIKEEKQIPPGPAESRNTLSPSLQMNGSDGMFKYEEIVLERVSTPYSPTSSLLPLAHSPAQLAPHASPAGGESLVSAPCSLWRLSQVSHLLGSHQGGLTAPFSPCTLLQKGGRRASPFPASFTPSPPQTHQCRAWGEGSLSLPLSETRCGELGLCRHRWVHPTTGHRNQSHPATRLPATLGHTALGC